MTTHTVFGDTETTTKLAQLPDKDTLQKRLSKGFSLSVEDELRETNPCVMYPSDRRSNISVLLPGWEVEEIVESTKQFSSLDEKVKDSIRDKIADILEVDDKLKKEFVTELANNTTKFREFLLKEIAPIVFGLDSAIDQTVQILKIILDDPRLETQTGNLRKMAADSVNLKAFTKLLEITKIDNASKRRMLNGYIRRINTVVVPIVAPSAVPSIGLNSRVTGNPAVKSKS